MTYCRNLLPFIVFTCMLLLAGNDICFAENITEEQWRQVASDPAFGYADEKEAVTKIKPEEPNAVTTAIMALFSFFNSSLGKVLLWTLFFAFLAWILFKVFSSEGLFAGRGEKLSEDEPVPLPSHDTDLLLVDWERSMQQAMKAGDMAMAIKYSYLHLLKLLQQKDLINFRSDKTNHEYYREIKNLAYRKPFKQLTSQYEYIWYGKYPVSEQQFSAYMSTFDALKTKLTG
jgi:hypothetical protein